MSSSSAIAAVVESLAQRAGLAYIIVIPGVLLAVLWWIAHLMSAKKGSGKGGEGGEGDATGDATTTTAASGEPRRVRTEENEFVASSSRLDLMGSLVTPWRSPRSRPALDPVPTSSPSPSSSLLPAPPPPRRTGHAPAEMQGWLNFVAVLLITYVVSNAVHACLSGEGPGAAGDAAGGQPTLLPQHCFSFSRWFT
jgi:hypothetical protein